MTTPDDENASIETLRPDPLSDDAASALRTRQSPASVVPPNVLALAAIALWGTLAWLGVRLSAMPPFLLVGSALTIAGLLAGPTWRGWRVRPAVFALGIYGLFGFHFFLFVALRLAPPLQANLVNYLWPLAMVLLAPVFLRGARLSSAHVIGGLLGLAGAVVAITNGRWPTLGSSAATGDATWGYAAALVSAFVWATYSLIGRRMRQDGNGFPTSAIGAFCLASGLLALGCHAALEPPYAWRAGDVLPLAALAIGPMGAAFFLWDAALRAGDARTIGTLAYLTPVISTVLLGLDDPSRFGWPIVVALVLVVTGAFIGARTAR
jgi:drug/metabolite transporter (DMT)-like permease